MQETSVKKNPNIEWIRILAMLMVVTLHALRKGGILGDNAYSLHSLTGIAAWILESLSVVAVNLYVLISGYLLADSRFKTGRLLNLLFEVLFYALGGLVIFTALGIGDCEDPDVYTVLSCVLPVHMETYWFMTAYVVMYLMLPILTLAVRNISKKQLLAVIAILLVYESIFKSVLPFAMGIEDNGYSFLWFVVLFLTSAYFKKFGFGRLSKPGTGLIIYFACAALIFIEGYAIGFVSENYGHLELLTGISYDYNHIFVYLGAIGLFAACINARECTGAFAKAGCFLGKYTLGVYLLHENPVIRYKWVEWFGLTGEMPNPAVMVLKVAVAVLCVYAAGTVVDILRTFVFKAVSKAFSKTGINKKIIGLDAVINGAENS